MDLPPKKRLRLFTHWGVGREGQMGGACLVPHVRPKRSWVQTATLAKRRVLKMPCARWLDRQPFQLFFISLERALLRTCFLGRGVSGASVKLNRTYKLGQPARFPDRSSTPHLSQNIMHDRIKKLSTKLSSFTVQKQQILGYNETIIKIYDLLTFRRQLIYTDYGSSDRRLGAFSL